ncbi:DNA cytosine methyltransferase [Alterisphingorhabdus coralli]|uniref:DNA (cytosine-5-)-methyltransferase n=1 Tax=Alterisphingorhabdus coralli TaxID=3071408 RepID=A0AA97I1Q5_9SPHN|nr:DNA cytosine methyltransferase [Parasphingorhabdus sp. SCSIO 66989]WOE76307.1 DNA cytosine methyltransferase [Parasphingorhabdus sp. SCSIO 66989]
MTRAYYNEIDPHAAQWLRNLIDAGLIAYGDVDERDIRDIKPVELAGYTQCHFFAGIGVWSYALRLAGWPDERPVWTGSCPCQPFSGAGKRKGTADERHLWPFWHYLIEQCEPGVVFAEQVASKDGLAWLDLVQADLEGTGYTCGPFDLCAAGFGAPHIRQRTFLVAQAQNADERVGYNNTRLERQRGDGARTTGRAITDRPVAEAGGGGRLADLLGDGWEAGRNADPQNDGEVPDPIGAIQSRRLADSDGDGRQSGQGNDQSARHGDTVTTKSVDGGLGHSSRELDHGAGDSRAFGRNEHSDDDAVVGMEHGSGIGREWGQETSPGYVNDRQTPVRQESEHGLGFSGSFGLSEQRGDGEARPSPTNGFWRDADWLFCRDGKWRPVESGTFPLVDGSAYQLDSGGPLESKNRANLLKGFGNAIVSEVAAYFIATFLEHEQDAALVNGRSHDDLIGDLL